jgi:integrase
VAKHRGAREGSLYQRASDQRWVAAVTVGEKQTYLCARTREEARQKLRQALRDREAGKPITGGRQTVGQFLERWLADSRKKLRPSTFEGYSHIVRNHLIPGLGKRPLALLSPRDVDAPPGSRGPACQPRKTAVNWARTPTQRASSNDTR